MINYNANTVRDGWLRPTDESAPDLSQVEIDAVHVLITPATCSCDKTSDATCNVCDGGLAICSICGKAEAELDGPCVLRL